MTRAFSDGPEILYDECFNTPQKFVAKSSTLTKTAEKTKSSGVEEIKSESANSSFSELYEEIHICISQDQISVGDKKMPRKAHTQAEKQFTPMKREVADKLEVPQEQMPWTTDNYTNSQQFFSPLISRPKQTSLEVASNPFYPQNQSLNVPVFHPQMSRGYSMDQTLEQTDMQYIENAFSMA